MYDSIGQGHLTLVAKIRVNVQTKPRHLQRVKERFKVRLQ